MPWIGKKRRAVAMIKAEQCLRTGAFGPGYWCKTSGDYPGIDSVVPVCRGKAVGRKGPEEITLFKSVGLALEDLAAAKLAYLRLSNPENEYASLFD